jgi:peptidoglycan/xylan/chitin deacetylase (PgdA/CDA1 family)
VVDVGAHTLNHPVLSALTPKEQREEILGDRDALGAMCGRAVRTFSYPYGGLDDYTGDTVEIVRDAGFRGACSNHLGVVKPWIDPFRLPRNVVRNWDAPTLAAKIETWFRERA